MSREEKILEIMKAIIKGHLELLKNAPDEVVDVLYETRPTNDEGAKVVDESSEEKTEETEKKFNEVIKNY